MPQLAIARLWQGCRGWQVWIGFAFPGRPQPRSGLAPLEVWLLVHWAPPGKNVRDPKLNFVQFVSPGFSG